MALARIITRSHQYAQQLALDLLARGYAVEIITPDATPNGPADLELRVEAGSGEAAGQLTEIRERGKAPRSLEYLQRLKPMMADLLRRWPASDKTVSRKDTPEKNAGLNLNAEQDNSDDVEVPSTEYQSSNPPAQAFPDEPEFTESARLISSAPNRESASTSFSITGEPLGWPESEPEGAGRSEVWFWRAAVAFASLALLILVLGMALRRSPAAPAQPASAVLTQPAAVKAQAMPVKTTTPSTGSVAPALPAKPAVIRTAPSAATTKAKPTAVIRRTKTARVEEVEVGDTTITYFKAKAAEVPKENSAKQGSGIKHYSDLN